MSTGYVANLTSVYYGPDIVNYPSGNSSVGPNETVDILWREGSWYYIEYQAGIYRKRMYIRAISVTNITGSYSMYTPTKVTRFVGRGASTYNGPGSTAYASAGSVDDYEQVSLFPDKIENGYALIEYNVSGGQKKRAWYPYSNLGVAKGLDTAASINSQSLANAIRDAGYTFVGRYYGDKLSDGLSAAELTYLHNAGLSVFPYFQSANNSASCFTYAKGIEDAGYAYMKAYSLGQPGGTNIYFAVDYDATTSDVSGCISSYFNGVISKISELNYEYGRIYNVGVYGGTRACEGLTLAGIKSRVLASGWDYNPSYTGWTNKQFSNNNLYEVMISGVEFNVIVSKEPHAGGWAP